MDSRLALAVPADVTDPHAGDLASLIAMHTQLRSYKGVKNTGYRFAVMLPISVYLGWITVATVANFTSVAVVLGWGGLGFRRILDRARAGGGDRPQCARGLAQG